MNTAPAVVEPFFMGFSHFACRSEGARATVAYRKGLNCDGVEPVIVGFVSV